MIEGINNSMIYGNTTAKVQKAKPNYGLEGRGQSPLIYEALKGIFKPSQLERYDSIIF